MPTDVYFPLPAPSDPGHLAERHPYGPLPGAVFNTDLGIEIQRSVLSKYPLLAVADGVVRLIPGRLSPVLVLGNVRGQSAEDLQSVVGESLVVFLYRNVDITSVADSAAVKREFARWQSSAQNKENKTLAEIRAHFLAGKFQVEVKAGDALGFVVGTGKGNPHLGFEVIYTPSGLDGETGWLRLTEILNPANQATRRLDPTSFYHLVASGPTSTIRVKLPGSQASHGLLPKLTKRILLELRDEYDLPFQGIVNVADSVSAIDYVLTASDRGTFALPTPSPGDRTISITNRVLTELPSGSSGSRRPTKSLSAPAHWSLQSIFMDHLSNQQSWFAYNESRLPLFTEGNRVTPLIDGTAAFKEMVQAMQKVRGSTDKHFLRLSGWWLSDDFEMIPGQAGSKFARLTEEIARSGGDVRALVWRTPWVSRSHFKHNSAAVDRINRLKQGSKRKGFAILDPANVGVGSHHQKFMIASAGNDLAVAFCGGVDINPNRLDTPFHTVQAPYHDVHAKVEGPAVVDLNVTFVHRWNFNPEVSPSGSLPRIDPSVTPATKSVGSQFVQVTRTYPRHCSYPFAPLGETGTLLTLRRAIQRARRFIYFEDQYVTPYAEGRADGSGDTLGILTDLLAALHRIEYLIIVLPNYAGQPNGRQFRYRFIRVLEAEAKKPGVKAKVLVFYLRRDPRAPKAIGAQLEDVASQFDLFTQTVAPGTVPPLEHSGDSKHAEEIFAHSKIWLIDDVYAKIGSANVNRRSLTHDSELDIHVIDGAITRGARRFAREFRLQLWGEMLNARPDYLNILLEDPSYALQFWQNPPNGSLVVPYNAAARGGSGALAPDEATGQGLWHSVVDPDGQRAGGLCLHRDVRPYAKGGAPEDIGGEHGMKSDTPFDFGERALAYPGEPDELHYGGFGKSLVQSTDRAITSGELRCSADLMRHLQSEARLIEASISTEVWDETPFSAADLFDAFTSNKLPGPRKCFNQFFEVVAAPRSRIGGDLRPGDLLVCRALGEGNLAHVALIVTGEALRSKELAAMGLRPDSWRPGLFVEVVDTGPFPHCRKDRFVRRLGDENWRLSHDCLVLRISVMDRPFPKSEMAAFEYDVEDLSSGATDFSLQEIADGTLGMLPDEILAAILTRGESDSNDLTDRAFGLKHPDLKDKTLDPKDPKQKALRDEWGLISRRGVKPIIWLRQVIDHLDRHRGDIPREFLLGWMATESDGQVSTVSKLGERGYFQIMWQSGEAKSQLGLTEKEFLRLSVDREFSIEKGVQLAKTYRQHFLRKYPSVPDGSDLLWRLTKGRHALPISLDNALDGLVKAGAGITWQAVSRSLPKMASGVDRTLDYAAKLKPMADRVSGATAAAQKPSSESVESPEYPGFAEKDASASYSPTVDTEAAPTPVLHLEKIKISGLGEITLTVGSGGRYEGFFATPIHLRPDQTSFVQTDRKDIEVIGRIQIDDSGTRRNYDVTKDGKDSPLGGVKGSAPVKIVNADGPIISGVSDGKVRPDGTFTFTTDLVLNGYTRSLTIFPKVELKGGKTITATVVVELTDLEGFLALVDAKEKARPSSQTHLEFLASVRKIYQGGPKDPLSGHFDEVLYRFGNVKPLVAPGSAEDMRFNLYRNWLFADRDWVDIGHVLTGIEGSPKQEPAKDQSAPMPPQRRELIVTWVGDLGSALHAYIKDFWNALDTGAPIDLNNYLSRLVSSFDLIGDIDGINIGSAYDPSRSLAENLRDYYGKKSRRRYREFIANSKDRAGKAELPLVPGKTPPKLSKQARQAIADNIMSQFLVPLQVLGKLYPGADPYKRKLIDEIVKVDSPEMNMVVEYFAYFLENGLAREP